MKQQLSHNEATFSPQEYKTFPVALNVFFEKQCPKLGGPIMREALVKSVYSMVCQFFPETSHLKPGQCPWVAVDKNETTGYGKSMKNTSLVPVVVDLIGENDIRDRRKRKGLSPDETANASGCSSRLVKQYLNLIDEFTNEGAVLEKLELYDARIAPHYEEHPGNELLPSEKN